MIGLGVRGLLLGTLPLGACVLVVACGGRAAVDGAAPSAGSARCAGVAATCGASQADDCCASPIVEGGTFYRSYDGVTPGYTSQAYPATVGDFRLDKYAVTVGRFRRFVATYDAWREAGHPEQGAAAHPRVAGSGWGSTWSAELPADAGELVAKIACSGGYQTWTDRAGPHETLPINCVSWYEAAAFCAWDEGRLATEAERNYAAAAGAEQRVYPWGSTQPGPNADLVVYGCHWNGDGPGSCRGVENIAPVGSAPAGDGKYGQSDLSGNLAEWNFDWYADYVTPCTDCAATTAATGDFHTGRVLRGGGFLYAPAHIVSIRSAVDGAGVTYGGWDPAYRDYDTGFRCARAL